MTKKEKYESRKKAGLCVHCGNSSDHKVLCRSCTDRQTKTKRLQYLHRKQNGLCLDCGVKTQGTCRCKLCFQRWNKSRRNWGKKKIDAGLCGHCGLFPHDKNLRGSRGFDICRRCYLRDTARRHLGSTKLWNVLDDKLIGQNDLCAYTGEPIALGVNAALDHIFPVSRFPDKAKDPENVCWVTREVNVMKNNLTLSEFIQKIGTILRHCDGASKGQAMSSVL